MARWKTSTKAEYTYAAQLLLLIKKNQEIEMY